MPAVLSSVEEETDVRVLKPAGHVGFDSLANQLVNKCVKNGFVFNIMCIGETGLGKSTLMDTLFNTSFESTPSSHNLYNVKLKANTYELRESNVHLKLTVCETVGYGDQMNKHDSFKAVEDYINVQFETYLQEELKIKRSLLDFHDSRVHVCLYFISPTGHGLKSLDIVCMKQLDSKVNIIPIIAKSDTVSKSELKRFKERIMNEIKVNEIKIYQFPIDDEVVADANAAMNDYMPFAVVGSIDFVKVGTAQKRVRQYPWGTVQVENETHSDFVKLREMLIRTNMEDMREQTHLKHYEMYRQKRLQDMGYCEVDNGQKLNSFENFVVKRSNYNSALLAKEEEIRQMFVQRVKIKEVELKESEREMYLRFDKLRKDLTEEKQKLEKERRNIELEYVEFATLKNRYTATHNALRFGRIRKK